MRSPRLSWENVARNQPGNGTARQNNAATKRVFAFQSPVRVTSQQSEGHGKDNQMLAALRVACCRHGMRGNGQAIVQRQRSAAAYAPPLPFETQMPAVGRAQSGKRARSAYAARCARFLRAGRGGKPACPPNRCRQSRPLLALRQSVQAPSGSRRVHPRPASRVVAYGQVNGGATETRHGYMRVICTAAAFTEGLRQSRCRRGKPAAKIKEMRGENAASP